MLNSNDALERFGITSSLQQSSQFPARPRCKPSPIHSANSRAAIPAAESESAASPMRPMDVPAQSRHHLHSSSRDRAPALFPPRDTAAQTLRSLPLDRSAQFLIPPSPSLSAMQAPALFP